jgi:hypothetical protein
VKRIADALGVTSRELELEIQLTRARWTGSRATGPAAPSGSSRG